MGRCPGPTPLSPPRRFIKSERSIILLNFCVSILASNILILVGQSQMLSKVGTAPRHGLGSEPPGGGGRRLLPGADWIWINSISGLNSLRGGGFDTTLAQAWEFNRRGAGAWPCRIP